MQGSVNEVRPFLEGWPTYSPFHAFLGERSAQFGNFYVFKDLQPMGSISPNMAYSLRWYIHRSRKIGG